ncbi:MAG: TM2 domain-containing protein, partial [Actinobacteria bacterium]|nr:TM2 domain-containing protein [Actinomycetota bacterium]
MATEQSSQPQSAQEHGPPHISNVHMWGGHPDRNYYVFIVLSVLFGFFGLDHFYLRSFETGFKKFIVNIFGLGLWYFWDIIQIASDGAKIRKEGLSSPFDWIRGIGYGAFLEPNLFKPQTGGFSARKSYLLYAFLAIFLGCFGFDKFYMGYLWQGLAKCLSCFNIFLFLFGWLWVLWDSFHAFFLTKTVLEEGITPPMPYNFVFDPIPTDVFQVTPESEQMKYSSGNLLDWIAFTFGFPPVPTLIGVRQAYREIVAPLITVPVIKTLQATSADLPKMPTMPELPSTSMPSMPTVAMPGMATTAATATM